MVRQNLAMLQSKTNILKGFFLLILIAAVLVISNSLPLSMAPDVTFKYIDGRRVELKQLENRPVLVTFWATTCSRCMKEMPHLITLYNALSAHGLEIVGVAMSYDPPDRVLTLTKDRKVPYPISLDIDGAIAHAFADVSVTPTTFLIAPDGRIIDHIVGALNMEKLRLQIADLLIDPQVTKRSHNHSSHMTYSF